MSSVSLSISYVGLIIVVQEIVKPYILVLPSLYGYCSDNKYSDENKL